MKIAWYTHRYHPCVGGAETYGRSMTRRFVEDGHQVEVLTSDARDLWYFTDRTRARIEDDAEAVVDGARVHRFPIVHPPAQKYVGKTLGFLPHWRARCRFASYMPWIPGLDRDPGRFDAVFALGFPFTVFSLAALRTARRSGAPLILTPFLHLATPGDRVHRHYTRPHQARLLREADAVVVVTELEGAAVESWGVPRDRILRVNMGFERSEVLGGRGASFRRSLGIPADRPLVGHLATLDPNKGTTDLVRAIGRLNERRPADEPIALVLAGAPSPDFERFERTLPRSTRSWLYRTGPLPPERKADFYDALDLFAMPSRTDSFGIVFLEAWANAKPVVAASAGGVVEVVDHGETGLLVEFGNIEQLARSIEGLVLEPDIRARLGAAGRAKVAEGFTWDDCFDQLASRLRSLKGEPARREAVEAPARGRSAA